MVRSSFSILFAIRESKARKSGKAPIEITITINGDRCTLSKSPSFKKANLRIIVNKYSIISTNKRLKNTSYSHIANNLAPT